VRRLRTALADSALCRVTAAAEASAPEKQVHDSSHFAKEHDTVICQLLAGTAQLERCAAKAGEGKRVSILGRELLREMAAKEVKQLERARQQFVESSRAEESPGHMATRVFEMVVPPVDLSEEDEQVLAAAKMQNLLNVFLLGIAEKELWSGERAFFHLPREVEDEYFDLRDDIEEMGRKNLSTSVTHWTHSRLSKQNSWLLRRAPFLYLFTVQKIFEKFSC